MNDSASKLVQAFLGEYRLLFESNRGILEGLSHATAGGHRLDRDAWIPLSRMIQTVRDAGMFLEFPLLATLARVMGEVVHARDLPEIAPMLTAAQVQVLADGSRLIERIVQRIAEEGKEPASIPDLGQFIEHVRAAGLEWPSTNEGRVCPEGDALADMSDAQKVEHLLEDEPKALGFPLAASRGATQAIAAAPDMVAIFVQDAEEILDHAEQHLMQLEAEPARIHDLLGEFHTLKGNSGLMGYDELQRLSHRFENVLQQVRDRQSTLNAEGMRFFLETIDVLRRSVAAAGGGGMHVPDCEARLQYLDGLAGLSPPVRPLPPGEGSATPVQLEKLAAAEQEARVPAGSGGVGRSGLRISVERLDQLNDLTSELVIASAVVAHVSECRQGMDVERFNRAFHQLNLLTSGLQDVAIAMRMVPIELAFRRLHRLVRDLSDKTGKPVDLQVAGAETEVDRRVTELIADPLIHIVRNAMDHGIEPAAERRRRGKPETGTIRVEALHRSGEVWVMVSDDGRGFHRGKILERARSCGLIGPSETPRDEDLFRLVFEAGFSTAERVSEVSGRGVGLDVVRKNIERLRGRVEIQSSEGLGSTMTIRLPLTLAVIHGMLIRAGGEEFVLPVQVIRESLLPSAEDLHRMTDRCDTINLRGEIIPLFELAELLTIQGAGPRSAKAIVTVVEDGDRRAALWLDEIIGQQRVVVKSLGESMGHIVGVSGASILADGRVRLILDVPGLIRIAHERAG